MPAIPGPAAQNPAPPGPTTFRNICTNALTEINVVAPGEPPDPLELAYTLDKANQLADSWSTQQVYISSYDLIDRRLDTGALFLLTPGLSPHTIGPTAIVPAPAPSFLVANERPVRIANANILLSNVNPIV